MTLNVNQDTSTISPVSSTDSITISATTALIVPTGNTSQRPTSVIGGVRFNTDTSLPEFSTASNTWVSFGNAQTLTYTGDVTGSGFTGNSTALTLATVNTNVGTWNNVTVNGKGLVTAGSNVAYLTTNQTITASGDATVSYTHLTLPTNREV